MHEGVMNICVFMKINELVRIAKKNGFFKGKNPQANEDSLPFLNNDFTEGMLYQLSCKLPPIKVRHRRQTRPSFRS